MWEKHFDVINNLIYGEQMTNEVQERVPHTTSEVFADDTDCQAFGYRSMPGSRITASIV